MPPFCLSKVCASRLRPAASASGSTEEHAIEAGPACLSGRGRPPTGSVGAGALVHTPEDDFPHLAWTSTSVLSVSKASETVSGNMLDLNSSGCRARQERLAGLLSTRKALA